jgi:hypothetical protein
MQGWDVCEGGGREGGERGLTGGAGMSMREGNAREVRRGGPAPAPPRGGGISFSFSISISFSLFLLFLLNKNLFMFLGCQQKNILCDVLLTTMVYAYDE